MSIKLLLIESATRNCSVALSNDEQILELREETSDGFVHAEKLHLFTESLLDQHSNIRKELSAVAVSVGPGSYTGLRIGMSLAKGLCFSLNIPLIVVSSLKVLFYTYLAKMTRVDSRVQVFWPMIDARRMEVYTAGFFEDGSRICEDQPMILDETTPAQKGICIGDGADKAQTLLESKGFTVETGVLPSARGLLIPSLSYFSKGSFADTAYAEPTYLKAFQAGKLKRGI